ncbi:tyrosine-protein phosphatase [Rhodococcus antarcticus]|jgi:protein-tyrosine phosphatase|uniref:Tyrosine-protein phosphatase n=1 Tax=Rhodococcus antarcticus TaxID=2987751 RepID=A0ABY6NXW3_9NOCA|nr:tyrosine-protein phosphatase [Rhodococcus antarcticus]UZJ24227.1 tyrosine-protein phosphatase [Rhodococcus antarcticus]
MTSRDVRLDGAVNVRDLGGLSTVEGRRVRAGKVLRSASLADLTDGDARTLLGAGLRTVVDLRGEAEAERDGRGALAGTTVGYRNLPVVGARSVRLDQAEDIETGSLLAHYVTYLETSADVVVEVVRLLGRTEAVPAVVHCAAGKDRTGVVVAVLLDALGVERAQIVADYTATEANMPLVRAQLSASATTRELGTVPDWVLTALPETMEGLLAHLDTQGGTVAWLQAHGLTDDELAQLRATLVE